VRLSSSVSRAQRPPVAVAQLAALRFEPTAAALQLVIRVFAENCADRSSSAPARCFYCLRRAVARCFTGGCWGAVACLGARGPPLVAALCRAVLVEIAL